MDTVRCGGRRASGDPCRNVICERSGNRVMIKKHGRLCVIDLCPGQVLEITCERCGHVNEILGSDDLDEIEKIKRVLLEKLNHEKR